MVRLVVTSDLHLGITLPETLEAMAQRMAAEQPDLTVLAGDLGEPLDYFQECLSLFAELPGDVAVLAGNHDVWAADSHHSQELWENLLPTAVAEAGLLWLENTTWQRDGVAIVGSLAWYDYSAGPPHVPFEPEHYAQVKERYNNDAVYIDWPWTDPEFAGRLGDDLYARLMGAETDADVSAIVLVTHVPLFEEQLTRRPHDIAWEISTAYFGNLALGRRVLDATKLRAVVSGHTHLGREASLPRPDRPDAPPIRLAVVPSEYEAPAYIALDVPPEGVRPPAR
jgi:3',5'-cyclic AMP phosphodiesterase CpdA